MSAETIHPNQRVDEIRARLDHPIIDSDGHMIEFLPAIRDRLKGQSGEPKKRTEEPSAESKQRDEDLVAFHKAVQEDRWADALRIGEPYGWASDNNEGETNAAE